MKKYEEIRKYLAESNYEDVFKAMLVWEGFDGTEEEMEEKYEAFMDNDYFLNLLDPEIIEFDPEEYWAEQERIQERLRKERLEGK